MSKLGLWQNTKDWVPQMIDIFFFHGCRAWKSCRILIDSVLSEGPLPAVDGRLLVFSEGAQQPFLCVYIWRERAFVSLLLLIRMLIMGAPPSWPHHLNWITSLKLHLQISSHCGQGLNMWNWGGTHHSSIIALAHLAQLKLKEGFRLMVLGDQPLKRNSGTILKVRWFYMSYHCDFQWILPFLGSSK